MSELEIKKNQIMNQLKQLCAHCCTQKNFNHVCPVQEIAQKISSIRGVPLLVNNEFKGVIWA